MKGLIPAIADPERRESCRNDIITFAKTYFPLDFYKPVNVFHREFTAKISEIVKVGGCVFVAAPRSEGKSTWSRVGLLHSLLYAESVNYAICLTATATMVRKFLTWFSDKILYNDLFAADFPELCFPFRFLGGSRKREPIYGNEILPMRIDNSSILFPDLPFSPFRGRLLECRSFNAGSIRGSSHTIRNMGQVRPGLVLFDDVETEESAASEGQNTKMLDQLKDEIKYLGGPFLTARGEIIQINVPIIGVGTCVAPNDAVDQIINGTRFPEYRGKRYQRVTKYPVNMNLWLKYADIRRQSFQAHGDDRLARAFYVKNRKMLDKGCKTLSDWCNTGMISPIHSAMDLWADDEKGFFLSQQNDPRKALESAGKTITHDYVLEKIRHGCKRYVIPDGAVGMVVFIDINEHWLAFESMVFGPNGEWAHTVDHGIFPEQESLITTKRSYSVDLQDVYHDGTREENVVKAMQACIDHIVSRPYKDEKGKPFDVAQLTDRTMGIKWRPVAPGSEALTDAPLPFLSFIGIDVADGTMEESLWAGIAEWHDEHPDRLGLIVPRYGMSATRRLIRYMNIDLNAGEWQRGRIRDKADKGTGDWIMNAVNYGGPLLDIYGTSVPNCIVVDSNTYKSYRLRMLLGNQETGNSLTLFDAAPVEHELYARHQTAEEVKSVLMLSGRSYDVWRKTKRDADNEHLDTCSSCFALASFSNLIEVDRSDSG